MKSKDLTGQKFNCFTVWFKGDIVRDKQYWVCKCECGNIRFANTQELTSGKRKHCGCKRKINIENIQNKKFNRLKVIEFLYTDKFNKAHWECLCDCGNKVDVTAQSLKRGEVKSCKCYKKELLKAKQGPKSHNWKGGRSQSKSGYIIISVKGRTVAEHVYLMEQKIGRRLYEGESVHHKNGIRNDNNIDNLELWASNHPSGQRVDDLVKWAKELLNLYEPSSLTNKSRGS